MPHVLLNPEAAPTLTAHMTYLAATLSTPYIWVLTHFLAQVSSIYGAISHGLLRVACRCTGMCCDAASAPASAAGSYGCPSRTHDRDRFSSRMTCTKCACNDEQTNGAGKHVFPACPKQVSIACASEDAASDGTDGDYVVQTTPSPLYPCLWVWEQGSSGMGKTFAMELGSIALSHVVTIEEEYIADGARRCVVLVNELPDCNLSNPGVCPTLLRFLILPAHRALCACMLPLCASFHMGPPGARQAVNVGRVLARRSTAALRKPLCAMQKTAEAMRDAAARAPGHATAWQEDEGANIARQLYPPGNPLHREIAKSTQGMHDKDQTRTVRHS